MHSVTNSLEEGGGKSFCPVHQVLETCQACAKDTSLHGHSTALRHRGGGDEWSKLWDVQREGGSWSD